MSSGMSRRNMVSRFNMMVFRSITRGESTCLRLKATNCCVIPAARCAADRICLVASNILLPAVKPSVKISLYPMMTVSRLLKSWATPPARRPIASIFCDCRSFSARATLSVTS